MEDEAVSMSSTGGGGHATGNMAPVPGDSRSSHDDDDNMGDTAACDEVSQHGFDRTTSGEGDVENEKTLAAATDNAIIVTSEAATAGPKESKQETTQDEKDNNVAVVPVVEDQLNPQQEAVKLEEPVAATGVQRDDNPSNAKQSNAQENEQEAAQEEENELQIATNNTADQSGAQNDDERETALEEEDDDDLQVADGIVNQSNVQERESESTQEEIGNEIPVVPVEEQLVAEQKDDSSAPGGDKKDHHSQIANSSSSTEALLPAAHASFSQRWTSAIHTVRILICRFLKVISHYAATHPWTTVICTILLSLTMLVIGYATNFTTETNGDILWPPRGSTTKRHQEWIEEEALFTQEPHYIVLYIHADGENILGKESVSKAFDVFDMVTDPAMGHGAICDKPYTNPDTNVTAECGSYGVFEFWNRSTAEFEEAVETDEDAIVQLSAIMFPDGKIVAPDRVFGTAVYDRDTGLLESVKAYRLLFTYPIWDDAREHIADIIDATLDLQKVWDRSNPTPSGLSFHVEIMTSRSFDDEFGRAIVKDLPLMPMAFVVMSAFCIIVFARRDRVRSQSLLGFGAVVSVLLAVMTGYGLLFMFGVPFTSSTQIVVFVMFGIGLDDAFIIAGSYSRTDPTKNPVDRIADTIDDIGLSISITTLTSALALATGCISSINSVYWLCLYAFPTIIIDFIYQITFFLALVVIDERRMQQNKMDCLVCISVQPLVETNEPTGNMSSDEPELSKTNMQIEESQSYDGQHYRKSNLSSRIMSWYAGHLLRPWAKVAVLLAFAAYLGASVYATTQLYQEMDFVDLVPNDSYIKDLFEAKDAYAPASGVTAAAFFRFVDQSDPSIQAQMQDYFDDLVGEGGISAQPPYFWVPDFNAFVNNRLSNANKTFNERMDAFLADPLYNTLYKDMIVQDPVTGDITGSRVLVYMEIDIGDSEALVDQLSLFRTVSGNQPVNEGRAAKDYCFFINDDIMNMWEFYAVVPDELRFTTVVGVVSVTLVGAAFIPHWTAVLFVFPSITTVYIALLGFLHFVGVRINPLSYITLVMSIGLLVDFIMHILIRYYECRGKRQERVVETLVTMGSSILIGGISTFLGIMLLSFSTSEIFSTIFRAFIGLVVLGCAYGLVLLPVVLSLVGPEDDASAEIIDPSPMTTAGTTMTRGGDQPNTPTTTKGDSSGSDDDNDIKTGGSFSATPKKDKALLASLSMEDQFSV